MACNRVTAGSDGVVTGFDGVMTGCDGMDWRHGRL